MFVKWSIVFDVSIGRVKWIRVVMLVMWSTVLDDSGWITLTYVDELSNVSFAQVVQHRSVVQVCQVGHILALLVLWWIQLLQQILLDRALQFAHVCVVCTCCVYERIHPEAEREKEALLRGHTYVDQLRRVSLSQIVQHTRIVQVGEAGHVFALFVFGRVQLLQLVFLDRALRGTGSGVSRRLLQCDGARRCQWLSSHMVDHGTPVAHSPPATYLLATVDVERDHVTFGVADVAEDVALLLIGDPEHLLAIVRLGLIFSLLLERNEQVLGRIRVLGVRHDCVRL